MKLEINNNRKTRIFTTMESTTSKQSMDKEI